MRSILRPPTPPTLGMLALVGAGMAALAAPARGQPAFWGWGAASPAASTFSPDRFADYLHTGQPPHPALARIVAPESGGTSLGSGVLVDANRTQGLVLTNWHVIRDSRSAVLVQFPDGFQSAGTVVRWDEAWDLAAIVIWKPPATPVVIAAEPPRIGERLTIAGFGRGAYREQSGDCTEYLSPGGGYAKEFVELRATARQGDSGGAIFNDRRELAGVLFGQNDGRTIGSCSTRLRTFLAALGSRGFTPTPIAEFSAARALDRGIGVTAEPPVRLAEGAGDGPVVRSRRVPAAGPGWQRPPDGGEHLHPEADAVATTVAPAADPAGNPAGAPPQASAIPEATGAAPPAGRLSPTVESLVAELLDLRTNGQAMLSAAGGVALVGLGIRTIVGGRRRRVTSEVSG